MLAVDVVFTVLGWVGGADHDVLAVVFRWSAPVGVLLMLAVLVAAGARNRRVVGTITALAVLRVLVVLVAVLVVGTDDANGRADPSYLLLAVLGVVVALAGALVAVSVLRALRPGRRAVG